MFLRPYHGSRVKYRSIGQIRKLNVSIVLNTTLLVSPARMLTTIKMDSSPGIKQVD